MIDLLNNEVNIGDKIAFLPTREWKPYEMQYGIVTKMTKDNGAAWCHSLNNDRNDVLRFSHQIIKLN